MLPRTLGSWLVIIVLALGTPAWAHVDTVSEPIAVATGTMEALSAARPSTDGVWMLAAGLALAAAAITRRRRAVAIASITLLVLVAFEAGVHSVHHLADQRDAHCVVASASTQTAGVTVDATAFDRPVDAATSVTPTPIASAELRPAPPDLGRAPPVA